LTTDPYARTLLHEAIATASPSGSEEAVVTALLALLEDRVDEAYRDEVGNLVVRRGEGPTRITMLGHVDTVPGDVPVLESDGALYGRGSVDAKGPLVASLAALTALPREALTGLELRVIGAVGEEAPGSIGARHVLRTQPQPDYLIINEPSGWDAVTLGYKGTYRTTLRATRPSHHAAGPDPTASDDLLDAIMRVRQTLQDAQAEERAAAGGTLRAFDALQGKVLQLRHAHDGLEERAEAVFGMRLPPTWPPDRVASLLDGVDWPSTVTREDGEERLPAVKTVADGTLQRAFRTAIRAQGGTPRRVVKTGTSDWNVVHEAWPVPTLAYGPGDAGLDHTPNEHLDLGAFDASIEVLKTVWQRLAEAPVDRQSPESS